MICIAYHSSRDIRGLEISQNAVVCLSYGQHCICILYLPYLQNVAAHSLLTGVKMTACLDRSLKINCSQSW